MPLPRTAVAGVWAAATVAVVVAVAIGSGAGVYTWLAVILALAVVAGLIAQLGVGEQHGFVGRLAAASTGAFVIVVVGALVAVLLRR